MATTSAWSVVALRTGQVPAYRAVWPNLRRVRVEGLRPGCAPNRLLQHCLQPLILLLPPRVELAGGALESSACWSGSQPLRQLVAGASAALLEQFEVALP